MTTPELNSENLSIRSRFYKSLYDSSQDQSEILKMLSNIVYCYGYDITTIVFLFKKHKLSAKIQFESLTNEKNTISFYDGQIQFIELADADTRIGTLMVNERLITKNQLEMALKNKATLPLGVYLVQQGIINKEQIGSLMLTQSRTRLSKLIHDHKYNVFVLESDTNIKSSELNSEQFYLLLHDWILSKFQSEWLNAHYLEYYNNTITVNWSEFNMTDALKYSVLNLFNDSFIDIIDQQNISDLAVKFENNKNFFKALHFLVLLQWITLKPATTPDSFEVKIKHVYKLIMNKNGNELLNQLSLITKEDEKNIDSIHEALHKYYLGPETLTNDFKLEIDKKVINLLIKSKSNSQSSVQKNTSAVLDKKNVPNKSVDLKLIKSLLIAQKYNEALALVKKHKDMVHVLSGLQLYSAWALLGLALFKGTQVSIGTLEGDFLNILPEDMNTADYHYVNYLLLKIKKQEGQSALTLKKAIELDPAIKNYPTSKSLFDWF